MKHLDCFSGYGGFTIACERHGIETIGFKKVFIAARTTATTIAVKKLSIITFGNK